ncbi:MAG: hypothetical protein LUH05_05100 [Candidatus Gastranaerophilales bacterium]|nr:hypothetical protein [Candidatus Gastranaerophilales bacterium]
MEVKGAVKIIPVGLIIKKTDPKQTIENVELRTALEQAVENADLYVTERMALNKKFYPNGGGFELFSKNNDEPPVFMFYSNKKGGKSSDSFTKEVESIKIPEDICRIKTGVRNSSKSNYQANLDNALRKLKNVLKGNI